MKRAMLLLAAAMMAATFVSETLAYSPPAAGPTPVFTEFCATLLQSNEVDAQGNPAVPFTGASGSAHLLFDRETNTLSYEVRVTGIPSATLAHIHKNVVGKNGPIIFDLKGSRPFDPSNLLSGTLQLTPDQVTDLFTGQYYVNVHTVANPSGELRGQVFPLEVTRAFRTRLLGANEVPPVATNASGNAWVWLNDAATKIDYQVSADLTATAAHIHLGAAGINGPVVIDLLGSKTLNPSTVLTGSATITPTQFANLLNGQYYVNVHTATNPGGELRGQLGPTNTRLVATLSGAEEVPPVATEATGYAAMNLSPESGQLDFEVRVSGLTATAAHIHLGARGSNGPITLDLLANGGGSLNSNTPIRGTVFLTPTQVTSLLSGATYVNVHTSANPSGEIRGQLLIEKRYLTSYAALSPANEVPPVNSPGSGEAALTVDATTKQLAYKVTVANLSAAVTLAHIHVGAPGVAGPIVIDLLGTKTLAPGTPLTGTVQLTSAQLDAMSAGNYYVNVHTSTNPGGEVRGQIYPYNLPANYFAALTGASEVPPVTTTAFGSAEASLDATQTRLTYYLDSGPFASNVLFAHIHRGVVGQNGPIIYSLTGSPNNTNPRIGSYAGTIQIAPEDLNDLLLDSLYFNVHTQNNPNGEVRGQILVQNTRLLFPAIIRQNRPAAAQADSTLLRTFTAPAQAAVPHTIGVCTGLTAQVAQTQS